MSDNNQFRVSNAEKYKSGKKWFKDRIDSLNKTSFNNNQAFLFGDRSLDMYSHMATLYNLFNNKINKEEFEHICKPFGSEVGELPSDFTNKDIISGKIKALMGMEMKRPFAWKVVAINEEATTRREQAEFQMVRDYVESLIMGPIQEQAMLEAEQKSQGQELTPDQQRQVQEEVQQKIKQMTPPEIKRYMSREHQDPAEALAQQILEYLIKVEDIPRKFNSAWKHLLIGGGDFFWVGSIADKPKLRVINPIQFDFDRSSESEFVEDSEWACYEMYLPPSEVVSMFPELTNAEIDKIYKRRNDRMSGYFDETLEQSFGNKGYLGDVQYSGVRVLHAEWKALKPIQFLEYQDLETGEVLEMMVDESYRINYEAGDINLRKEWIVSKYEGYLVDTDIYVGMREVPGQHRDMYDLHTCKLSYIGAVVDATNAEPVSLVSRMKEYQYLYNILMYKIETLIASDEGKALLLNANMIPKSKGIDVKQWMYFFKVNKIGLMDPNEEGNKFGSDVANAAKEIDLSLASQINNYVQLAQYIEERCGQSVGITKQIEGQIGNYESVRNTQQAIVQSANILEPYFDLHNIVKRNVLQALVDVAKICYVDNPPTALSYVLDDMSLQMLTLDAEAREMLESAVYGLFVSNSMRSQEALQTIQQLAHAALQNQKIELSDTIKVMRSEALQDAEEILLVSEQTRIEREQASQQSQQQAMAEEAEKMREWEREKMQTEHANKMAEIQLKGDIDTQRQVILAMGFNEDKDMDKDGTPDVLEVAKFGVDADIRQKELYLKEKELNMKDKQHADKMAIEKEKAKNDRIKANKPSSK